MFLRCSAGMTVSCPVGSQVGANAGKIGFYCRFFPDLGQK